MSNFVPGEVRPVGDPIVINEGRQVTSVTIENTGDRPVQVGSHFHFFEVNPELAFDREAAYGMRLSIPAGTAVRFEPGCEQDIDLVEIGGERIIYGMGGLVGGELDDETIKARAMTRAQEQGYITDESTDE
jgi:urease subunit beta